MAMCAPPRGGSLLAGWSDIDRGSREKGSVVSMPSLVLVGMAGAFAVVVMTMLSTAFFTVDQHATAIVRSRS